MAETLASPRMADPVLAVDHVTMRFGGLVAVDGWAQTSTMTAHELGRRFEDAGVAAIVHTDTSRDGVLKGLNVPMTLALAEAVSIPVIASGGLAPIADVECLL